MGVANLLSSTIQQLKSERVHQMICRVCGSSSIRKVGEVQYYLGYNTPVYHCRSCGGRLCEHLSGIHEEMHADLGTYYGSHLARAQECKSMFDRGDIKGLRQVLCSYSSRYRFIINSIEKWGRGAHLLEFGCSRGHLAAYFILTGYKTIGADVSRCAIESARENFGPNFFEATSPEISKRAPFDVIYHAGTIGCVSDPLGLTRSLLAMLKAGGQLLFNAPNVEACCLPGQLWTDWGPPPDVVTLFKPGVWTRLFSKEALVNEEVEKYPSDQSVPFALRKLTRRWRPPTPSPIGESISLVRSKPIEPVRGLGHLRVFVESTVARIAMKTGLSRILPSQPTDFGLLVTMTKK
jgi:SAM-dependent methyltransferase